MKERACQNKCVLLVTAIAPALPEAPYSCFNPLWNLSKQLNLTSLFHIIILVLRTLTRRNERMEEKKRGRLNFLHLWIHIILKNVWKWVLNKEWRKNHHSWMFSYFWNVNGGKDRKKSTVKLMRNEKNVSPTSCKKSLRKYLYRRKSFKQIRWEKIEGILSLNLF